MAQTFGIEASSAGAHPAAEHAPPARYLVLIDSASAGGRLARLFLASYEPVAEFDAAAPEVLALADGLLAHQGAQHPRWDRALAGHTAGERAQAQVFTFDP